MASIESKTVMMTQLLPARPLDPAGQFFVVRDRNSNPMIFSISNDGKLYLTSQTATGNNDRVDLGKRFGITKPSNVVSLNVTQDKDLTIYLVFASGAKASETILNLVQPFQPDEIDWSEDTSLTSYLYKGERSAIAIGSIHLGTCDEHPVEEDVYPFTAITFNKLYTKTDDVWSVDVDHTAKSWKFNKIMQLPVNAPTVHSICPGTYEFARGLFFLWSGTNGLHLDFSGYDPTKAKPTLINVELEVPPGANALATYSEPAGYSALLVGGDGLYHFSADNAAGGSGYTQLDDTETKSFDGVRQLAVAQAGDELSIWALNRDKTLIYQEFIDSEEQEDGPKALLPAVPLITYDAGGGNFSPLRQPGTGQSVYVLGADEQLRFLEQDRITRVWRTSDVKCPTIEENFEIESYTTQVRLLSADKNPLFMHDVLLQSSTPVSVIVNGYGLRLDRVGSIVKSDASGTLTIIMETDDVTTPLIYVKGLEAQDDPLHGVMHTIDPMSKLRSALSKITKGADLRKIKFDDGETLVDPNASDEDLDKALGALKSINDAADKLPEMAGFAVPDPVTAADDVVRIDLSGNSFLSSIWDFFNWVGEKITSAANWLVKKVEEGWAFVVSIGKKVFNFVIDTVTKIGKAIWKVLQTVGATIKKIIKFIGFLFQWGDIVDTHNLLVNYANIGIIYGLDAIQTLRAEAKGFIGGLRETVESWDPTKDSKQLGDIKVGKDVIDSRGGKAEDSSAAEAELQSPNANFGRYQLDHGGVSLKTDSGGAAPEDGIVQGLLEVIGKVFDKITKLYSQLGEDFVKLLTDRSHSILDLLKAFGAHALANTIGIMEEIVDGILNLLGRIFKDLGRLINEPIRVPVLGPLYKLISGGNELTILDAMCLILAIPTTIIYKLVSGKAPSSVDGLKKFMKADLYKDALRDRLKQSSYPKVMTNELSTVSSYNAYTRLWDDVNESNVEPARDDPSNPVARPRTRLRTMRVRSRVQNGKTVILTPTTSDEEIEETVELVTYAGKKDADKARAADVKSDFEEFVKTAKLVLLLAIPIGGGLWFFTQTVPGWFDSSPTQGWKKTAGKIARFLLWGLSFPISIARPGNEIRIAAWVVGVLTPIGSLLPSKKIAAGLDAFSCIAQTVIMVPAYIVLVVKVGPGAVDYFFMATEFILVLSKFCSAVTTGSGGQNLLSLLAALGGMWGGSMMAIAHGVLVITGKKQILHPGVIDFAT